MLELLSQPAFWTALLTLTVLEIVLGIEDLDALFERSRAAATAAGTGDIELAYYPSREWARRLENQDPFVSSLATDIAVRLHTGAVPPEAT